MWVGMACVIMFAPTLKYLEPLIVLAKYDHNVTQ